MLNEKEMQYTTLSSSQVWGFMKGYYQDHGPDAWRKELIPYKITTNKTIAHKYASIFMATILDYKSNADLNEPFYIFELGSGHGKFGSYLIEALAEYLKDYPALKVVFVLTDLVEENLQFSETHSNLLKYADNPQITFDSAIFDLSSATSITLRRSGKTISKNTLNNPVFATANYIFDSLTVDGFKVKQGELNEVLINMELKSMAKSDEEEAFTYNFKDAMIANQNYYPDENLNKLLHFYQKNYIDISFLVPTGAIQALNTVASFTKSDIHVLSADKGYSDPDDMTLSSDPHIAFHGSCSFMINFHAISKYFEFIGGMGESFTYNYTDLKISYFGTNKKGLALDTSKFTRAALVEETPTNMINLLRYTDEGRLQYQTLEQVLAVLNLGFWDPDLFFDLSDQLIDKLEEARSKETFDSQKKAHIISGLKKVTNSIYILSDSKDINFSAGYIFYVLDMYELAYDQFKISVQHFKETAPRFYNISLCASALGHKEEAIQAAKKAMDLDPEYEPAKTFYGKLIG